MLFNSISPETSNEKTITSLKETFILSPSQKSNDEVYDAITVESECSNASTSQKSSKENLAKEVTSFSKSTVLSPAQKLNHEEYEALTVESECSNASTPTKSLEDNLSTVTSSPKSTLSLAQKLNNEVYDAFTVGSECSNASTSQKSSKENLANDHIKKVISFSKSTVLSSAQKLNYEEYEALTVEKECSNPSTPTEPSKDFLNSVISPCQKSICLKTDLTKCLRNQSSEHNVSFI